MLAVATTISMASYESAMFFFLGRVSLTLWVIMVSKNFSDITTNFKADIRIER